MRLGLVWGALFLAGVGVGAAQDIARPAGAAPIEVITPVFHQLVAFSSPADMVLHPDVKQQLDFYIREQVPDGQSVTHWSQMITLTGARGAAEMPANTPLAMAERVASDYQKACPETYTFKNVGGLTVAQTPAYLVLVGCGDVADEGGAAGERHSESALIVVLKGDQDLYTLQWAERGAPSSKPLAFNETKWKRRFTELQPIRVCSRVAGEKAPYPSCLGQ